MRCTDPTLLCLIQHLPPLYTNGGGLLHHFTDETALASIVSTGEIWMTKYNRMCNDRREGGYVRELYDVALQNPGLRREVPQRFLDAVSEPRLDFGVIPLECHGKRVDTVPYVLCMSINNDDECMRDYYRSTGRGGWLGLNGKISQFGNCGGLLNNHYDECMLMGFQRMQYKKEEVVGELVGLIRDFFNAGGDPQLACDCIGSCLSRMSMRVKAPYDDNGKSTESEHEVRLVYNVPVDGYEELFHGMSKYRRVDCDHIALPLAETSKENGFPLQVYSYFPETLDRLRASDSGLFHLHLVDMNNVRRYI